MGRSTKLEAKYEYVPREPLNRSDDFTGKLNCYDVIATLSVYSYYQSQILQYVKYAK